MARNPTRTAVTVACLGSALVSLDMFVMNFAFSAVSAGFPGTSPTVLAWILNAFAIAFAASLVPAGRIADLVGRPRVFIVGALAFAAGSVLAALSPDITVLIAARALQGVGAGALVPTSLGIIMSAASGGKRMIAAWAAMGSAAAALGPVVAGLLIPIDWRWLFAVNVALALPAAFLARGLRVQVRAERGRMPDLVGSAALAAALAATVLAITSLRPGAALWPALVAAPVAVLAGVGFVARSRTAAVPALVLTTFRDVRFRWATIGMLLFYTSFGVMLLGTAQVLRGPLHLDPVAAGALFGLSPAIAIVSTVVSGRAPLSPRALAVMGPLLFVVGGAWWTVVLTATGSLWGGYLPGMVLVGLGAGFTQTAFIAGGTAGLPPADASASTGVINTARQVGSALGVAAFVALTPAPAATLHDFVPAWIAVSVLAAGAAVAGTRLRAHRTVAAAARPAATLSAAVR